MNKITELNKKFEILLEHLTDYMADPTDGPTKANELRFQIELLESHLRIYASMGGRRMPGPKVIEEIEEIRKTQEARIAIATYVAKEKARRAKSRKRKQP